MKKKIFILLLAFVFLAFSVIAAQINSANFKQNVIVSSGGENVSSSSFKMGVAVGIINGIISSSSFVNNLGFFHTWLLANGQPCASASQCEGGFCCSSLCASSSCPSAAPSGGGGAAAPSAGGGSAAGPSIVTQQVIKDFSVSPSSIQESLVLGAAKVDSITITNTGNTALDFSLSVSGVSDFVFLSTTGFSLKPGQTKSVDASIVGRTLGSYVGDISVSAGGITKTISVSIDVQSQQVLFDVKIDIPPEYKEVTAGNDLKAQITLLNVGPPKKVDVNPTYFIKDKNGRVIYETSETFAVEKQKSYVKVLKVPEGTPPDDYIAAVEVRYLNSFATSSDLFKVVERKEATVVQRALKSNLPTIFIFVAIGIIFLFLYLIIPKEEDYERRKLRLCYKAISNAKEALYKDNPAQARLYYTEARKIYLTMARESKKEVYAKLMELYNKLK